MRIQSTLAVTSVLIILGAALGGAARGASATENPNNDQDPREPSALLEGKISDSQLRAQSKPAVKSTRDIQREVVINLDYYGMVNDRRFYAAAAGVTSDCIIVYRTPGPLGMVTPNSQTGESELQSAYAAIATDMDIEYMPASFTYAEKPTIADSVSSQTQALEAQGISLTWWSTETPDGPFVIKYDPKGKIPTLADIKLPRQASGRVMISPGSMVPLSRTAEGRTQIS